MASRNTLAERDAAHQQQGKGGAVVPAINKLQSAGALESLAAKLEKDRTQIEIDWKLNLAFYRGKQYAYYSKTQRKITQLPVDEGDKPRYRARIVANQIMPGCQSLLAKYTKTKPVMHATPASGSDEDLKAAQLADRLLEYEWEELSLDESLRDVMLWSFIGQGYWEVCYDPHAGKQLTFVIGPDGRPIVDDGVEQAFRIEAQNLGFDVREVAVYVGDIRVDVISPFDLLLDPSARCFDDCQYVIRTMYMSPSDVFDRWGKTLAPDAVAASPDADLPLDPRGNPDYSQKNVVKVRCGYFLPCKQLPKGRVVFWTKQLADPLEDDAWEKTYPVPKLPFVKFAGNPVPGQLYDQGVIQQAIPLQKELNKTLSQIIEQKNMTIRPQWMSPRGSMQGVRMTNEPGANWEFTPIAGMRPEPIQMPSIPNYVFAHLQEIKQRIADVFGLNEVMQGQVPPNVEAGIAIDLLQEMATDRLAPGIRSMEHTIADGARLILEFAKAYYSEPRLMRIRGGNGGAATQVQRFMQTDLSGAVDVVCEAGSALPRTRAGRQARVEWMMQNNLIRPEYAYKYLDTADLVGAADLMQLDEDQQLREIDMMITGRPFNQVAQQQAEQSLQQGVDPDTGEQFDPSQADPEALQKAVDDAGYKPGTFDNHTIHLDVTARFMKGMEYLALPADVQARILDHAEDHMEILTSLPSMPEGIAPRVSLQLKGAVGPTVASDVLKRSGVLVDPQTVGGEAPLDTWVTDSVDKPNAETGPSSPFAQQQADLQAQQEAQMEQAQQAQEMAQSADKHQQESAQSAQAHQAQMQQAMLKLAQARQQGRQKRGS